MVNEIHLMMEYGGYKFTITPYKLADSCFILLLKDEKHHVEITLLNEWTLLGEIEKFYKRLDYLIGRLNIAINCINQGIALPKSFETYRVRAG